MRVAILTAQSAAGSKYLIDALVKKMAEFGWREGVNIEYASRHAEGVTGRLEPLAAEIVAQRPDLILASTSSAAMAARKHTSSIPIVFSFVFDPVALGLVASLSRPGGNATGTTTRFEGLWGKRVQLLKEAIPSLRSVAVVYDPTDAEDTPTVHQIQSAARKLNVEVRQFPVKQEEDFRKVFSVIKNAKVGAAMTGGSSLILLYRKVVADLANEYGIPTFGVTEERCEAGMLISYGIDLVAQYVIAARFADRILRGARPEELPVEQPGVFQLCLNLNTAKRLGIKVPQSLLVRADRVIE
jgi:putative ABC transport system substrate-binding protein